MDKDNMLLSKAAEALAFLDWMCIDMGDSHSDLVKELCDLAQTEFPKDADDTESDILMKYAAKAYEKLIKEKLLDTLATNLSYYDDCINFIMQQIAYVECAEKSIEHMHVLLEFVKEKADEGMILDDELKTAGKLDNLLSSVDVPLVRTGHYVGDKLWRELDGEHYFHSNTGFVVGHITSEDEEAYKFGSYVCYADPLYEDDGYAVIFHRENGNIIAHVYAYERGMYFSEYKYSDMNFELALSDDDKNRGINELATYINMLPMPTK